MRTSALNFKDDWYLVTSVSGEVAVVPADDLLDLITSGIVFSALRISCALGRSFEENRAREAYMSANHRLKAR
jgi:hypothetical protein